MILYRHHINQFIYFIYLLYSAHNKHTRMNYKRNTMTLQTLNTNQSTAMFENRQAAFGRLSHSPFQYWIITFCLNQFSTSAADLSSAVELADISTLWSSLLVICCELVTALTLWQAGWVSKERSGSPSSSLPSYKLTKTVIMTSLECFLFICYQFII